MREELHFDPFFLIKSSFSQTVVSAFLKFSKIASKRKLVTLEDGDQISLEISTPKYWEQKGVIAIIVHGLCGSYKSPGIIRLTKKLVKNNIKAVRLNLRGCGSGKGLAKKTYHSGDFSDVFHSIRVLKEEYPESKIMLIGFSLGGNIVLKLAGEIKDEANKYLEKVIALSPPIDLKLSVDLFEKKENRVYLKYFIKLLREDIEYMKKTFPDFPEVHFPEDMSLRDFNNIFVVPHFGFKDLDDYYQKTSAKYVLSDITTNCKILFSEDDPIVSHTSLQETQIPDNVKVFITKKGGHLGYLGTLKDKRGFFWLDNVILDWIQD